MSHVETTVVVFARSAIDQAEARFNGVDVNTPHLGEVLLVRRTTLRTISDGVRRRVLDESASEEILATLVEPSEVAHLSRTLVDALARSLPKAGR